MTASARSPRSRLATVFLPFVLGLAWSGCEDTSDETEGCQTDNDCKGTRICVQGMCQTPDGGTSSDAATGSDPTTSQSSDGETTGDTSDTNDSSGPGSTTTTAGSTSGSTGSMPPLQPYGKCIFECSTDADCCEEHSCDGDTQYVCDGGLCRGECMASCESSTLGNFD